MYVTKLFLKMVKIPVLEVCNVHCTLNINIIFAVQGIVLDFLLYNKTQIDHVGDLFALVLVIMLVHFVATFCIKTLKLWHFLQWFSQNWAIFFPMLTS